MGFFDKVKKGFNEIAGDFKNEVSKINSTDVKNKLKDIKDVVSESYVAAVDKLEDKKELRVEVEKDFMRMRGKLVREFNEMDLKNRNEILNKYLRKEIKSFKDLELLSEVIYKGEVYKNPNYEHLSINENAVFYDIDSCDTEESIEVEILNNEVNNEKLENINLESRNNIKISETEVIKEEEVVQEPEKQNDLTIGDLIKEKNINEEPPIYVENDSLAQISDRELEKEKLLYDKIIKYIWYDIKKYAELYIFELSVPKKSLDTVSGICEVCKSNFTYKEMKHKDYMICSDYCLNRIKKLVKDLNNEDIEVVLRKHNEKILKELSKEDIELKLSNYNLIKLSDIEEKSWELIGNSHVFKSIKLDGSELYVNYKLVCEKDKDGIVKVLLTTDSSNVKELYNKLIEDSKYENLDLFKFMFI